MDNGHWEYPEVINPDEWFGFIYRVIEKSTGREYIGKKQFWSTQRRKVKGRKNRKVIKKESDWKTYMGSSTHLKEAIANNGESDYRFVIESLHLTKGSLYYAEVEKQVMEDVLRTKMDDGSPKYYNKQIGSVKFIPPDRTTEEKSALNEGYNEGA